LNDQPYPESYINSTDFTLSLQTADTYDFSENSTSAIGITITGKINAEMGLQKIGDTLISSNLTVTIRCDKSADHSNGFSVTKFNSVAGTSVVNPASSHYIFDTGSSLVSSSDTSTDWFGGKKFRDNLVQREHGGDDDGDIKDDD
jgi:hypothetical protein